VKSCTSGTRPSGAVDDALASPLDVGTNSGIGRPASNRRRCAMASVRISTTSLESAGWWISRR
jgi:hypothetical protein